MNTDFFKIIGIIIIIGYLFYLAVKSIKTHASILEGLTNQDTTTSVSQNLASSAQAYANAISKAYNQLLDGFSFTNYRTSYENTIIQMDDYVSALMLQKIMSLNQGQITEEAMMPVINSINALNSGKQSLNSIMKFIDAN